MSDPADDLPDSGSGTGADDESPALSQEALGGAEVTGGTHAPVLAGDDVRPGPELTDTPQAGGTEPTD